MQKLAGRDEHDAGFAERLARRDETVLADIDMAYGDHLRRLLRKHSCMDDPTVVEEVVEDALLAVWERYDQSESSVRFFLFMVAKRRLIDRMRAWRSDKATTIPTVALDGVIVEPKGREPPPDDRVLTAELRTALDDAVMKLTSRERTAHLARTRSARGEGWDTELANTHGHSPKYWRKASDDARIKIQALLAERGFGFTEPGGRYGVAARTSA